MKFIVYLLKKTEALSALSIRLVYWTGKSKVPLHPKHLLRKDLGLYKELLGKKKVVLDLGCGPGQHALLVAPKVRKIIGVDKDLKSLEIARKDAKLRKIKNAEFQEGNVEGKLLFKNKTFDSVILIDILEHVKKRQSMLKEVRRTMKENGVVLVVIPNRDTSWKRLQRKYGFESFSDPDHKIEYTKESIQKELLKAGFEIKSIFPTGYDTPWIGLIDLSGGFSIEVYKRLSQWKQKQFLKKPEESSGFKILAAKGKS